MYALRRRRPFSASSIPAPVHRRAIRALRQRFTLRHTCATHLAHDTVDTLDHVGAGARTPEFRRQSEPGYREDLVQSFEDGAGNARRLLLKSPGEVARKTLCLGDILKFPGLTKRSADTGVEMHGQAVRDVPALVDLATPDRGISPEAAADRRFAELLKETRIDALPLVDEKDHIHAPDARGYGYRAIHLDLKSNVGDSKLRSEIVPFEIQIRTRLQDAWAALSHEDIYKQADRPDDLEAWARDLADVLPAVDQTAPRIRSHAMRKNLHREAVPT